MREVLGDYPTHHSRLFHFPGCGAGLHKGDKMKTKPTHTPGPWAVVYNDAYTMVNIP